MKELILIKSNPNLIGGAEIYLKNLKTALQKFGIQAKFRPFVGNQRLNSAIKALRYNAQLKRQKKQNELYFSSERIECADIYRANECVHRVYRKSKKFWFVKPLNFVYPYLEKKCFNNAKLIIAISNLVKNQIIDTYGIDESKIVVIYDGINLVQKVDKMSAKKALCVEFGLDWNLPVVLFVGNGFRQKGVSEFLQILSKTECNFNALVVGKDKNMKKYQNLASNLGVNAVFTGRQKGILRFFAGSDLFLFPTSYEPFGDVVLEAMNCGCAVVTTANSGASEILDDKSFVLSSKDDENASKIVENLLKNPELMRETGLKNIEISKEFSIEKNAELTLKAINAYLN